MILCANCGRSCDESDFAIVDFDDETEEFIREAVCSACSSHGRGESIEGVVAADGDEDGRECVDVDAHARKLAYICCNDLRMISKIPAKTYRQKSGEDIADGVFETIRALSVDLSMKLRGVEYEREVTLRPGMYVIVGDSHGMYENEGASAVAVTAANHLKATIIHVGHALDIHGHISGIASRKGTVVVALSEEVRRLSSINAESPSFSLVRGSVRIGDLVVHNQASRGDMAVGIGKNIRLPETDCSAIVVGRHFHEMFTLTKHDHACRVLTPGCLCHDHVSRRIPKRIPAEVDMDHVMNVSYDRDRSGARQKEIASTWERGMIVIHVSADMKSSVYPIRIKKTKSGWAASYGRLMFLEKEVSHCEKLGLVVGDAHIPSHDPAAIDVVDRIAAIANPDYFVNLGDHVDCTSINHHRLERGEQITYGDLANECGKAKSILSEMARWAPERYFIVGNHSRFIRDFYKKFPQLEGLMNHQATIGAGELGYKVVELKGVLTIAGKAKFIHGDMRHYGAVGGDKHDRVAATMERDTMVGHCHNPSIRRGVYYVGMLGNLDQDYNEANASNWMHGFGLVSHFGGEVFMTTVGFEHAVLYFMGREVRGDAGVSKWNPPDFEAKVVYCKKK